MLSPSQFSKKIGLSYGQVLYMCKNGEVDAIKTQRGHYKIPEKELNKFIENDSCVSRENYEEIVRENERLKTYLRELKKFFNDIDI